MDLLTTECYLTSTLLLRLHASIAFGASVASKWHRHTRVTRLTTLRSFKSGFRRTRDKARGTAASPRVVCTRSTRQRTGFAWGKSRPPRHGKVFLFHHASSERHSQNQPPANTGNTGRSWLGCFWKAKQLKEMFSLIERGFLGPRGQFWRPESVQCTGSHLCFSVLTPCCFSALAEWWGSVDRDFKGTFRI